MKKLETALRKCRKFHQTYEKQIKIAVITLVVVTALLLFGGKGEKQEIVVEQTGETQELVMDDAEQSGEIAGAESPTPEAGSVMLVVDISGCIKTPGVYEVTDGTRLHQVIDQAGGLTKDADIDAINRAELVTDGQKILIPAKTESGAENGADGASATATPAPSGKININQADSTALQEIPGVGPATADKIIQYREANGRFQAIEDIKNVSGIGDKTFEKMKDKICV